jgi:CRP-like cAMP-binding protein
MAPPEPEPVVAVEPAPAEEPAKAAPPPLPQIPIFSDLPPDAFLALLEKCPLRRFDKGQKIIEQGTRGDAFYVVCEGSVRVYRVDAQGAPKHMALLQHGAFFGEMALLSGTARAASVESASEDTQVLEISAQVLNPLAKQFPSIPRALKKFCRQRLLSNVMETSELFRPFTRQERRGLVERFLAREVKAGDPIIREGDPSDGLYVVLSGEVRVTQGQGNVLVATLREGEIFGEMSVLTKAPAAATVSAAKLTSLLRLPREDFDALILSHPQILVLVSELTDSRRRQLDALPALTPPGEASADEELVLLV